MIFATISTAEIIAFIALVIGVIATIAAIVVVHNAKLKYALLFSLSLVVIISIIVLSTLPRENSPQKSNGTSSEENLPNSNSASSRETQKHKDSPVAKQPSISPPQPKEKADNRAYLVTLVIPSHMSDADILVDGRRAVIMPNRTPSFVTIRVGQKSEPTKILLRKGENTCEQSVLIDKDIKDLTLCK